MNPSSTSCQTSTEGPLVEFLTWGLRTCGWRVERKAAGFRIVPHDVADEAPRPPCEFFAAGSETDVGPLLTWLGARLGELGPAVVAVPRNDVSGVHEVASRLYAAYAFDGGRIQLAGCRLEDRPFLRLTHRTDDAVPRITHEFYDGRDERVAEELIEQLGMHALTAPAGRAPHVWNAEVIPWIERVVAHRGSAAGTAEPLAVTLIACRYAVGKLEFIAGESIATLPFHGWAAQLRDGHVQPPPFICPQTGLSSYHLAVDDEGRITVREALEVCAASGQRLVSSELATCAVSGEKVRRELLARCPVSGESVRRDLLQDCPMCGQAVSPTVLRGGRCEACRQVTRVRQNDPRLARLLDEYPKLDRWQFYRMSETATAYVLVAASLWQKLLVIVDKEHVLPQRLATSHRFARTWDEIPAEQYPLWLE